MTELSTLISKFTQASPLRCCRFSVPSDRAANGRYSLRTNQMTGEDERSAWRMANPPREMLLALVQAGWRPHDIDYVSQRALLGKTTDELWSEFGLNETNTSCWGPVVELETCATLTDLDAAWPGQSDNCDRLEFAVPVVRKLRPTGMGTMASTSPAWTGDVGGTLAHEAAYKQAGINSWIEFTEVD